MNNLNYHFIGIGGISMSSLAFYLKNKGCYVQGSDLKQTTTTKILEQNGITVFYKHSKNNLKNIDVVVYSFAIGKNNIEFLTAKQKKLKVVSRAELLAEISKEYKNVIAISGSHGKTSTTKMIYNCLKKAGEKPTLHIGGMLNDNLGIILGDKKFFVTEACEFHNCFLSLKPKVGVVLNVEKEHLDFFGTFKNELNSFKTFSKNCKNLVCFNKTFKGENKTVCFGNKNCDIVAKNIKSKNGKFSFDCYINDLFYSNIKLGCLGLYNIKNALATIGVMYLLKIDKKFVLEGLKEELNIKRRFEIVKVNKTAYILTDYAHHPTEIENSLKTFKTFNKNKKYVVVFQPHTYSRTKNLFNNFVNCFKDEKNLIIFKTYSAREKFDKQGSAYSLYKSIKTINKDCKYVANMQRLANFITKFFNLGYSVLILGAGDVVDVFELLK